MSFKHFFKTCLTENEIKENFKTINESRWWGKFKEDSVSLLEVKTKEGKIKKYKVCKLDEDGNGPAYVLEARNGARYGLFRATEGKFHCIRMKSGKKNLIKTKEGVFKEVNGKLVFEKNDSDMSIKEVQVLQAPDSWKNAIANDPETWTPKPGTVADFSKSSKNPATIAKLLGGSNLFGGHEHPYKFFVGNDNAVYQILNDPITKGVWAISKTDIDPAPYIKQSDPTQDAKLSERRATAEPDKSFPNGEPTFDKNTDEWNKGVYTDAKA